MIPHRALQGCQHVCAVVGAQQRQHAPGLVPGVTLLTQQALQEAAPHLPQLSESLLQQGQLLTLVGRWPVRRVDLRHAGAPLDQGVARDRFDAAVVDQQLGVTDAHRHELADQPPRGRVPVVAVADAAFRVHHPVDHLSRVVVLRGQGEQVRLFFRVRLERAPAGASMGPHVGYLGQPPARHLIQVLQ